MTEEQNKILSEVYNLKEDAQLSNEEIQELHEMFNVPEKFKLIRKALRVLTKDELGIQFTNDVISNLGSNPEDWEKFGKQVAIINLADEKIRQALSGLYILLQNKSIKEKKEEFEIENLKAEKEKENRENIIKEREEEKQVFGARL